MTAMRRNNNPYEFADRHHTLYPRREWQRGAVTKLLRSSHGMILPLPRYIHNEIHDNVEPPRVITPKLGALALDHLVEVHDLSAIQKFDSLQNRLWELTQHDREYSDEAHGLALSLKEQGEIIGDNL